MTEERHECKTYAEMLAVLREAKADGHTAWWNSEELRNGELIVYVRRRRTMDKDFELAQTAEDMKSDTVSHPTHYTSGCGFECIEMMEMVFGKEAVHDFCTLNAFKYLWRHRQKGGADDIGKAKWYLEYTKGLGIFKNRQAIDKMNEHISKEEANK